MSTLDGQENWQTQSRYCIDAADALRHGKSVSSSESITVSGMGSTPFRDQDDQAESSALCGNHIDSHTAQHITVKSQSGAEQSKR